MTSYESITNEYITTIENVVKDYASKFKSYGTQTYRQLESTYGLYDTGALYASTIVHAPTVTFEHFKGNSLLEVNFTINIEIECFYYLKYYFEKRKIGGKNISDAFMQIVYNEFTLGNPVNSIYNYINEYHYYTFENSAIESLDSGTLTDFTLLNYKGELILEYLFNDDNKMISKAKQKIRKRKSIKLL